MQLPVAPSPPFAALQPGDAPEDSELLSPADVKIQAREPKMGREPKT